MTLLLLAASAGCRHSAPVDTSLLSGDPCEPPCWQGLVPGVSTEEEVNEFIQTSELVDRSTLFRGKTTRATGEIVGETVQWWSTADMANAPRQFGNRMHIVDGLL
ncbi:MAG: hypothetical protein GTN93_33480, partial [Anaerolineae bacterium]|nr:hypothetical protein [Anaerolineae bacterium]NIQ82903.1 hypothetical protein [Anaerolineae bacterium]